MSYLQTVDLEIERASIIDLTVFCCFSTRHREIHQSSLDERLGP